MKLIFRGIYLTKKIAQDIRYRLSIQLKISYSKNRHQSATIKKYMKIINKTKITYINVKYYDQLHNGQSAANNPIMRNLSMMLISLS